MYARARASHHHRGQPGESPTDSPIRHGDRGARTLLHQIHHLPEKLAGVGGAGTVHLERLRRNAGGSQGGDAGAKKE